MAGTIRCDVGRDVITKHNEIGVGVESAEWERNHGLRAISALFFSSSPTIRQNHFVRLRVGVIKLIEQHAARDPRFNRRRCGRCDRHFKSTSHALRSST